MRSRGCKRGGDTPEALGIDDILSKHRTIINHHRRFLENYKLGEESLDGGASQRHHHQHPGRHNKRTEARQRQPQRFHPADAAQQDSTLLSHDVQVAPHYAGCSNGISIAEKLSSSSPSSAAPSSGLGALSRRPPIPQSHGDNQLQQGVSVGLRAHTDGRPCEEPAVGRHCSASQGRPLGRWEFSTYQQRMGSHSHLSGGSIPSLAVDLQGGRYPFLFDSSASRDSTPQQNSLQPAAAHRSFGSVPVAAGIMSPIQHQPGMEKSLHDTRAPISGAAAAMTPSHAGAARHNSNPTTSSSSGSEEDEDLHEGGTGALRVPPRAMYARTQKWQRQVEQNRERSRRLAEEAEMAECYFTPRVTHNSYTSGRALRRSQEKHEGESGAMGGTYAKEGQTAPWHLQYRDPETNPTDNHAGSYGNDYNDGDEARANGKRLLTAPEALRHVQRQAEARQRKLEAEREMHLRATEWGVRGAFFEARTEHGSGTGDQHQRQRRRPKWRESTVPQEFQLGRRSLDPIPALRKPFTPFDIDYDHCGASVEVTKKEINTKSSLYVPPLWRASSSLLPGKRQQESLRGPSRRSFLSGRAVADLYDSFKAASVARARSPPQVRRMPFEAPGAEVPMAFPVAARQTGGRESDPLAGRRSRGEVIAEQNDEVLVLQEELDAVTKALEEMAAE